MATNDIHKQTPSPPAKDNPRRSLVLFAAGAMIGLGIAAYGLFTAEGTQTRTIPPQDVAVVNGRHILRSDFIAQTEITWGAAFDDTTPEQRQRVLQDMINEELLVQRGLEIDLAASDADVRAAMVSGVNFQVDADITARQPADEELMAFYRERIEDYASEGVMRLRDLYVRPSDTLTSPAAREVAGQAVAVLRSGTPVETVMAMYELSDSGKVDQSDQFDFAAKIKLGAETFAAASPLTDGQTSEPFTLPGDLYGDIHIVYMERRLPPVPREFADARDTVLQDFKRAATEQVEAANADFLRRRAEILIVPELQQ